MTTVNTEFKIVGDNKSGQAFARVGKSIGGLNKQAAGANRGIGGLGKVLGGVGKILPALGFAASTAALGAFAKGAVDAADELGKISTRTGVTVETLSSLEVAARQGGTSIGVLEKGLSGLSRRALDAAKGSKSAGEGFAELGIEVKDSNGNVKDADTLYGEVADKIATMEDGTRKNAIAQKIFGKSGADLIPVLNGGSKAMSDNITTSEEFARQSEAINDRLDDLSVITKQVGNLFLSVLLPPTLKLVTGTVNLARALGKRLKPVWDTVIPVVKTASTIFFEIAKVVGGNLLSVLGSLAKVVGDLVSPFFNTGEETKKAKDEVDQFGQIATGLQKALGTLGKFLVDTYTFTARLGIGFASTARKAGALGRALRNIGRGGLSNLGAELARIDRETNNAIRGVEARGRGAKEAIDRATGAIKPFTVELDNAGKKAGEVGDAIADSDGSVAGKTRKATEETNDYIDALEEARKKQVEIRGVISDIGDAAKENRSIQRDAATGESKLRQRETIKLNYLISQLEEGRHKTRLENMEFETIEDLRKAQEAVRKLLQAQKDAAKEKQDAVNFLRNEGFQVAREQAEKLKDEAIEDEAEIARARKNYIEALRDDIKGAVSGFITGTKSFGEALAGIGKGVLSRLTDQISGNIADALIGAVGKGENAFAGLANGLPGLFQGFFNFLGNGFKTIANLASGLFGGIGNIFKSLFGGGGGGGIGSVVSAIGGGLSKVVGGIGKFLGIGGGGAAAAGGAAAGGAGASALVGTPVAQVSGGTAATAATGGIAASSLLAATPILGILGLGLATSRPGGNVRSLKVFQEILKEKLEANEELTQAEINYAKYLTDEQRRREVNFLRKAGSSEERAKRAARTISRDVLLDRALERIGFTDEEARKFAEATRGKAAGRFDITANSIGVSFRGGGAEEAQRLVTEEANRIIAARRAAAAATQQPATETADAQLEEQKKNNQLILDLINQIKTLAPNINVVAQIDGEDLANTVVRTVVEEQQEGGALYPGAGGG